MQQIHLTLENIMSPIQQIVLQLRHGIANTRLESHQKIRDEKILHQLPVTAVIVCKNLEFHLSSHLVHRNGDIERHIHLPWKEYEKKRNPGDHGRILPSNRDELLRGMVAYLAHRSGISFQAIKTIYHAYDCFGELLYTHPVVETSWISDQGIENFLRDRLSLITELLHSEALPPCSEEEKGRLHVYCDAQCPVRSHCEQRKQDIEETEQRALLILNPTQESEIPAVLPDICGTET